MRKFNMSNKPATPVYLLLTLCASLLIVSCSSEEPTLEFSEEFLDNTQLTVWWASASEDAPIQVDFYNAEPNTYYKLVRSTNTDCDIQDESTCNDYKLLAELTHTMESGSQYTYYDNFISTRQYYQLYIYYPELDLNSTLPYGYIYENLPNRPNVHTTSAGNSEVYLDWDWAHGAIYYNIYYSTSSDISLSNYQGSTSTTSTEITITSLTNETSYYFIVVGVNDNGMSDYNIEGSITPSSNSPPSSPTNVTTLAGNSAVYLSWDATNNTDYYRIYYATFSGVHSSNYENFVDVSSGTSYTIDGLSNDITYYFVVYAVNPYGDSSSAEVFAVPSEDSTSLLPPSGIVATSGDGNISITWNAVSVATSYNLYVAEEGGITIDNYSNLVGGVSYSTEETGYLLDDLINGTTHYLILTAVDADGNESISSSELSATPQLPVPSDFTVAASSGLVDLTWSADSGLTYEIYKTTDSACDLSAHDDFSQCSDSGGSTEATFPDAQSPIADDDVTNGTLYYYWFKAYRDSEYRYADRVSALPFDYAAGINFEEASHVNLFTMSGNGDWYIDSTSGGANGTGNSFRSGSIAQGQTSCASFVGTVQDGSLRFYYRTDSSSSDGLRFYINNSQVSNFGGGSQAWTSVQLEMSAGEYTLMWCYEKYDSVASNSDSVWIDEIAFDTYAAPDSMTGNYLNDTGITVSMNSEQNLVSCDLASSSPQDCNSGRDSSDETNTSSDGSSGFSFTKIDAEGNALASDAGAWSCVLDNFTGLLWQNASSADVLVFSDVSVDSSESICGRTGWRLPRIEELRSIVDYSSTNNASVDSAYFTQINSSEYWSSTVSGTGNHVMYFYNGDARDSGFEAYYTLVNSGNDNSYLPDAWFDSRYIDNGDGTISDKETNLIWQRCPHGMSWQSSNNTCTGSVQSQTWDSALLAAANDTTGEHSWRLPNIKELSSIVHHTSTNSYYVNGTIFPAIAVFDQYSYFWSSSPAVLSSTGYVHVQSLRSTDQQTARYDNTYPYLLVRTNPQIYPNAPYNVEATADDGNVSLTWGNVSTATSYKIYYSTNSGAGTSSDNSVSFTADMDEDSSDSTSTYTITGLSNGTTYYFVVTAIDAEGDESPASPQANARPVLPLPSNFAATVVDGEVRLTWTADNSLTYEIYRTTDSDCDLSAHNDFSQCSDSGGSADPTFPNAESPVIDQDISSDGTIYHYWLKVYRDTEYSYADRVSVLPAAIDFETASHLDLFIMSGDADWYIDDTNGGANGSSSSLRSGVIGDNQSSCTSFVATVQDSSLQFYYRIDSESVDDLRFYINDTMALDFGGGTQSWTSVQLDMSAGEYTFKWCYEKDGSVKQNSDAAWIDEIAFVKTYAAPDSMTSNYLNDTGITTALSINDQAMVNCAIDSSTPQDCNSGRDSSDETNTSSDGSSGFSFTKIDANGDALASNAAAWSCIFDNVTGLLWQNSSSANSVVFSSISIDSSESICGRTGWRLPRIEELRSIVDYSATNNSSVDSTYFTQLSPNDYWSSTGSGTHNYVMYFYDGDARDYGSGSEAYYTLVNSTEDNSYLPDAWFDSRYIDNGDGSVSDKETNLIWQRCPHGMTWQSSDNTCTGSAQFPTWDAALSAAASETTGGQSWRLPNIKELASIVNHTSTSGYQVNTNIFPASDVFDQNSHFWSSSPSARSSSGSIHVHSLNSTDQNIANYGSTYPYFLVRTNPQTYPNAPYSIEASAGDASVTLTWSNISTATSYKIYYSETSATSTGSDTFVDFNSSLDEDSSDSTSTYTITGLSNGTTYYFVVTAIDAEGDESSASAQVNATPALPFPDDFSATGGNTQVTLDWTVTSGIDYVVHRSTDSACDVSSATFAGDCTDYATIAYVDGDSTIDGGLSNATTYYYWLEASRSGDASRYSSTPIAAIPNVLSSNRLNDTGISAAVNSDGTLSQSCVSNIIGLQDCNTGRDAHQDTNSSLDGYLGFNFTKLDNSGKELLASATTWECVRDNVTGLVWEKSSTPVSSDSPPTVGDDFEKCGLTTGWSYPRIGELVSIVDYSKFSELMVDTDFFTGLTNSYIYYSSTMHSSNGEFYGLYLSNSTLSTFLPSSNNYHYLLVNRSFNSSYLPDSWSESRYIINNDGSSVTDISTNLIWQRCSVGQTWDNSSCSSSADEMTLPSAIDRSDSEWRLPNVKELASLVPLGEGATLDTSIFPNAPGGWYWTASVSDEELNQGYPYIVELDNSVSSFISTAWYGNSSYARLVKPVESSLPASPYGLEASAGDASATLTWSNISTATSYKMYYSETSGTGTGSNTLVDFNSSLDEDSSDSTSTYTVTGLSNGTTYYFVVTAIDGEGDESSASAQVSATPALPFPDDFSATGGNAQVTLDWTVTSGIGYVVHRSTDSACDVSSDTPADNCTDYATIAYVDGESTIDDGDDITNGTTYYYWLEASRSGDASRYSSAPVSATPNVLSSNRLNDTGISVAINSDGTLSGDCSSDISGLQDCHVGRDADQDTNSSIDGNLGFNFTKLDSSGNELSASATSWECVRDNVTGLVWEKSSTYVSFASPPTIDDGFEKCGLTKWRYPRLGELISILNYGQTSGAMVDIDYFLGVVDSDIYYSSNVYHDDDSSYGLYLSNGTVSSFFPGSNFYRYLLVSDSFNSSYLPDSWANNRYIVSADGSEVSDVQTNLIWQRCSVGQIWDGSSCGGSANSLSLTEAMSSTNEEWRLPNIKELASLVVLNDEDYLNSSIFPAYSAAQYWTNSPSSRDSGYFYVVEFSGMSNVLNLTWYDNSYYARLVKSVESPLPASPYGLEASAGDASVTLTWSNISTASSYKIYYSETSGAGTSSDKNVSFTADMDEDSSDSTSTYTVTGLNNGTTYYFVVTAIDGEDDESSASAQASATPVLPLPSDFAAVTTNDEVRLTWSPTVGIAYEIYKTTDSDCDLSSHNDFSQCSDSDGSAEATFPNAESPVVDQEINSGEIVYYWLKGYRDTEYGYADRISVLPTDINFEVASHLDLFTMSGNADWYIDDANGGANGTSSSLRSGDITDNQTSCTSFAATAQDSILNFYYRTDSESYDRLKFYIDDSVVADFGGGIQPWTRVQQNLFAGEYVFKWCYEKDGSQSPYSDAVWIDEMSFESYVAPESMTSNYLNDTGITTALNSNGTLVSCDPESTTPQDCNSGRDSSDETNGSSDGSSGFSFTKINADGNALASDADTWNCVLDNITGLLWQNSSSTSSMVYSSISLDSSESICGRTGWRLPRLEELRSIVDYSSSDSASVDNAYLSQINSSYYWSSTKLGASNYVINFSDGDALTYGSSSSAYYILVNSTEENSYLPDVWFDSRYIDNGDGTISDKETNLIWQRCPHGMTWQSSGSTCSGSAQSQTWESALSAAASDTTGGYSWRLPNIKELASIVDRTSISSYYINTNIFPASDVFGENSYFWSSSPAVQSITGEIHVQSLGSTDQTTTSYSSNYPYLLVRTNPQTSLNIPYNVEVTAGDSNASLTWGNISSATSYRIYYSTVSGEGKNSATSIDFNSTMDEDGNTSDSTSAYTITNLANATTYYFVVTAVGSGGESDNSAQVSATPLLPFPDDFVAVVGDGNVTLSWSPPTGSDGISYSIHRSTDPECPVSANLDSSSCSGDSYAKIPDSNSDNSIVDTGLTNGERYYYWLEAFRTTDDTRISDNPISAIPDADGGYYDFEGGSLPEGFSFSGAADWYLDTSTGANETNSSLRSGAISSGERSCVSFAAYLELNNFSNDFYFYYKMQRGSSSDRLRLYVNGVLSSFDVTTSSTDWQSSSINIDNSLGSGTYTFEFCFEQGSTSTSAAAWIDELSFTPGLELSAEDFSDNVLNDSGSQFAGNASTGNNSDCSFTDSAEDNARFYDQDCHSGRDANTDTNSEIDGNAGFAFTKLDSDGHDLPADARSWACVRDEVTGLVWENASYDAVAYSAINIDSSAELCGLSGWRLPRLEELRSIVDYDRYSPAVDPYYFQYLADAFYWSSTISNTSSSYYQGVSFYDGDTTRLTGTTSYRYVPVNSTLNDDYLLERWPSDRYTDNQDGTVTDTYTQLIWMRCSLGQEWNSSNSSCDDDPNADSNTSTWLQALSLADKEDFAGAIDWRLPNVKELASLLKVSVSSPTIDSTAFPNTPEATFWTSTPSFASPDNSFFVNFYSYIGVDKVDRDNSYYVRLVRSPPATAPASPYGLSLEAGDSSLSLSWSAVSDATSYNIYLAEESAISIADFDSMAGAELHTSSGTSLTISELNNETRYYIAISALDSNDNESALSAELSAIPQLSFPSDFAVSAVGDGEIQLTWSAETSDSLAYNIYRSTDPTCAVGPNYSICANDYSTNLGSFFIDSGLTNGTRYYYWLEASRSTTSETRISTEPVSAIPTDGNTAYQDFAGDDAIRGVNSFGWYLDTSTGAADTTSSMRSGAIGNSQQSCMETYVSWQPGEFSFHYRVDSEPGDNTSDKLYFYIDDINTTAGDLDGGGVSGSIDWTEAKYTITDAADVTLKWCYIKDSTGSAGEDAAWIDQISLPGTVATYDPENLAMPLNDTGIDWGGNSGSGNNSDCTSNDTIDAPQDCDQGRDADSATNADADGHAGFSFTKLDENGDALDASATSWSCVQDNTTGLIWEVKTDDGGLHDTNDTYSWYDTNSSTNGGSEGDINTNDNICYGYTPGQESTYCNTEAFVKRVNEAGLCGHNDWRMPDINELGGLADKGLATPSIDTNYFPNISSSGYWSASPRARDSGYAWRIYFYYGYGYFVSSGTNYHVRLVRSEH